MKETETKRCRNMRRVLMWIFIICAYMLSTTFAYAYIEVSGEKKLISMTALNLALGSMGADHPVYRNLGFGLLYMFVPLIGFLFMFFDHKTNIKNFVGICCGIIGCLSIAFPIGFNENLSPGIGAFVSMVLYMFTAMLSGVAVFMKLEDDRKSAPSSENAPRLSKHK